MSKNAFKTSAFRSFAYEIVRRLSIAMVTRATKWSIKKFNEEPGTNQPKNINKENLLKFEFRDFLTDTDSLSLPDAPDLAGNDTYLPCLFESTL